MTRPSLSWAHRRHFSEVVLIVVFFSDRSGHWLFPGRTPRWIFFQLGPVTYFFYTAPFAVYFHVAPVNDFFQVATVADFFYRLRPSLSFCPGRAHGWLLFQVKTVADFFTRSPLSLIFFQAALVLRWLSSKSLSFIPERALLYFWSNLRISLTFFLGRF